MIRNMHTDILFNRSRGGIFMGKKAVVLSGGGAKGGYQIGVWKVLRQMGFTPDIVVGTSVGALNGALMALDNLRGARHLGKHEHGQRVSEFRQHVRRRKPRP